ncbi:NAD+ synthase [Candidatus Lucifugimonas marina]|jgi:NAD+ synthase (glutamine-hydrolysing)|uniref:Glutamine-dependent NAD(+) synthetase n=1 Tax=Candidatus Lucifugimonas marina TaxID=3038979 RepID=A0AAJ6CVL2_9CHLR|nr:NAD+ synthase [SAR202 cluster bacterium JH702]MDG0870076.1 NAD+ synthase [SAR202 cluster bacterium JH639]WFG36361.1 NAD+ synthase [SAR202 cluster bacterium JH545]WFG40294.1 NAD+ synthase [SAR202 cluster bacterium JH1073]
MTTDNGSSGDIGATLRVAAAQINTSVGDIDGNARLIEEWISLAQDQGADLVAFPELTITGYPPEDLVLYDNFIAANKAALNRIAAGVGNIVALVGYVDSEVTESGTKLYNAAAVIHNRKVVTTYRKIHLPNYGVFDERRYFTAGNECPVISIRGIKVGVNICEDIWEPIGPSEVQCANGAQIVVNLNSSPYESGKQGDRVDVVTDLSRRNRVFTLYTNQIGGQDELVFDGGSMLAAPDGELLGTAPRFEQSLLVADIDVNALEDSRTKHQSFAVPQDDLDKIGQPTTIEIVQTPAKSRPALQPLTVHSLDRLEAVYRALIVGTRDYLKKTRFKKVAIAVSGGIDSAIVTAIAVDAIGAENVVGVALPSRYSSEGSVTDAEDLCSRLGVELWNIPIEPGHSAFEEMLSEAFEGTAPGLAEENTQSRIRGNIMMTIANKFGWLVLTTGNKSEMATGYATLYGDMAGAYAVIKDVPKTLVYELCRHRNNRGPGSPIPNAIIDKPPSAELRPDQLDEDSLPPYDQLDRVIHMYIEERMSPDLIVEKEQALGKEGAAESVIRRIVRLIDINEYKRRQSPPGVKITGLAFGKDRRLPIASGWQK